jgi:hypothetical protein
VWPFRRHSAAAAETVTPVSELHLSGPRLRRTFEHLVEAAEATGGIERYVGALGLKASLFEEVLGKGRVEAVSEEEFYDLCAFIAPVRRRVAEWLAVNGFEAMRRQLVALLHGWSDVSTADARVQAFIAAVATHKRHRWARDLAAEVLHFTAPQHYPLMTRWIWDARTGTGVLREIWYADDVDRARIEALDDYATLQQLRDELTGFLADNGIFRDVDYYVDLLCAHVYAFYINDRGGQYLQSDFARSAVDPMAHTRRLLGLDAIDTETGRTRLKLIDGSGHVVRPPLQLDQTGAGGA